MTDIQKEPLPCPFCKGNNIRQDGMKHDVCLDCGAAGPDKTVDGPEDVDFWDYRPREAELEARVEALESFARDAWTLAASLHHSHNKFEPFRDYEFYSDVRRRALTTLNKQGGEA